MGCRNDSYRPIALQSPPITTNHPPITLKMVHQSPSNHPCLKVCHRGKILFQHCIKISCTLRLCLLSRALAEMSVSGTLIKMSVSGTLINFPPAQEAPVPHLTHTTPLTHTRPLHLLSSSPHPKSRFPNSREQFAPV